MSTQNIVNKIFPETLKILSDLIAFKTISGEDNNLLINYFTGMFALAKWLLVVLPFGRIRSFLRPTNLLSKCLR